MRGPKPNIHDIAREAGVSITTVSHSMNGRGRVQPDTRRRVLRTAERLGYTANAHAQRLVTGRHMTLALQVADLGEDALIPASAYYIQVLNDASAAALELGYTPMLVPARDAVDVRSLPIDGALIIDPTGDEALLDAAVDGGIEVITAGRVLGDDSVRWIDNDHPALTLQILDHLAEMGYERPALLTGAESQSYAADAIAAYNTWTGERGLEQIVVTVSEPATIRTGMQAARRLLKRKNRPDAIHTSFDVFALGTLAAARAMGLNVPQDLGISCGLEGYSLQVAEPPITAIELDAGRIGREAVSLLVRGLDPDEDDPGPASTTVPAKLNRRQSTKRAT